MSKACGSVVAVGSSGTCGGVGAGERSRAPPRETEVAASPEMALASGREDLEGTYPAAERPALA